MVIKVNHLVAVLVLSISFLIPSTMLASENVLATQMKLNELGFNAGTADGFWGNTSKNALVEYLSTKGLKFGGKMGKVVSTIHAGFVFVDKKLSKIRW